MLCFFRWFMFIVLFTWNLLMHVLAIMWRIQNNKRIFPSNNRNRVNPIVSTYPLKADLSCGDAINAYRVLFIKGCSSTVLSEHRNCGLSLGLPNIRQPNTTTSRGNYSYWFWGWYCFFIYAFFVFTSIEIQPQSDSWFWKLKTRYVE